MKPRPSSETVSATSRSFQAVPISTRLSAKSTAFSTRLASAWMIAGLRRPTGSGPSPRGVQDGDLGAEGAVGLDHLLDEMGQRLAGDRLVELAGHRGELGEDVAAALRLAVEESDVLGMAVVAGHLALELPGDQRDGGERRAELVGGGRGEPVERREMLLAGEHHLGRVEGAGELPRLLGDAEGVDAGEGAGRDQRHPDADRVDPGKRQHLARYARGGAGG